MGRNNKSRQGKIVTAGHQGRIDGLSEFLKTLEGWPEIITIRIGRIQPRNRTQGGGFYFRATRYALIGTKPAAIKCIASYGSATQEVFLVGLDLQNLKDKLREHNFGATWE